MPGFYTDGEYDLAGTIVGIVDRGKILDGNSAEAGDTLIGLGSSGLHTNGYSLARKLIFETAGWNVHKLVEELGGTIGEALLAPHRSYVNPVFSLMEQIQVKGIAHITGGGLVDNVPRTLPEGLGARISRGTWPENPIFALLQKLGSIETLEMFQAFNMGLGLVLVVSSESADQAVEFLHDQGEQAYIVGQVVSDPQKKVEFV
jgi:phosphoribosylformylglycinamidine cyclo-ligase